MSKPELGTKRLCAHCGAKFYDLHQSPIGCPKCGKLFEPTAVSPRFRTKATTEPVLEVEPTLIEPPEAQFISLEEADAEAQGESSLDEAPGLENVAEPNDEILDDTALIEESEEDGDLDEINGDNLERDDEAGN
jgi:uncharacterized protein (TIGR02300 family)